MSKRKLNRRQAWRVAKIQEERLKRASQRDDLASESLASGELGEEREGIISAHFGTQVEVQAGAQVQRCHMRANLEGMVTGDRVIWRQGQPTGVVVARSPRSTELLRPDGHGNLKPVAANIDQIIIVIAPLPEPHAQLIDRYLVAAEAVSIPALILFNKTDLLDASLETRMQELLNPYPELGYPVLRASCARTDGLLELQSALSDRTSIFVGQSGVGKSSLVNMLLPEVEARVGALSENRGKGTHTTTTAQWFDLPDGGSLIDSPGIREFGLWHMDRYTVENGFREFHAHLGHCRFRDCRHEQEPGCALLEAAANGTISERRLRSYRHIINSLDDDSL